MVTANWKCSNCAAFNSPRRNECWQCGRNRQAKAHNPNQTAKQSKGDFWLRFLMGAAIVIALIIDSVIGFSLSSIKTATAAQPPAQALQPAMSSGPQSTVLNASVVYKPAVISQATSATSGDVGSGFEPPVDGQGGTCIEGSIINNYEEPRGAGWAVTVTQIDPTKGTPASVNANASGQFSISSLSAGTYQVELKEPDGWRPLTPDKFTVTLNGSSSKCARVRFKKKALACLDVFKLDNHDKVGIPGWTITVTDAEGVAQTQQTDGMGKAHFSNLAPDANAVVQEAKMFGWVLADIPGNASPRTITLLQPHDPEIDCPAQYFINEQVHNSFIRVVKKDNRGQLLEGWHMTLTRDDGTQLGSDGITDPSGLHYFNDLALGVWTVTEDVPAPWWHTVGSTRQTVTLDQPGQGKEVAFVNEPLGCVDGHKINDLEDGLSGWQIKAVNKTTSEVQNATTNADGYFQFYLSLGTWTLSEVMQDGWSPVTPAEFDVDVTELFTCKHVRFKNRTNYACVDAYKKDYSDQTAGLPGWTINLKPAYGGVAESGLTDGSGWVRFTKLAPGYYILWEDPQPSRWLSVGFKIGTGSGPITPGSTTTIIKLEASGTCSVVTFYNQQGPIVNDPPPLSSVPAGAPAACTAYYTVQPGDTFYHIAVSFGVNLQNLQQANQLTDPRLIYANTRLCIP